MKPVKGIPGAEMEEDLGVTSSAPSASTAAASRSREVRVRVKCDACDGRGERVHIRWGLAVLTFGVGAIIDSGLPDPCRVCDGKGFNWGYRTYNARAEG